MSNPTPTLHTTTANDPVTGVATAPGRLAYTVW